jgi:hypothetical protein
MAQETQENTGGTKSNFQQEFNSLPLDQKFAQLFQMEVATLSEAAKYVADSSMKVLEQFGEALSDLGSKVEKEAKKAAAVNCDATPAAEQESKAKAKPKTSAKRKPAAEPSE